MKKRRNRRFAFWALLVLLAAWFLPSLLSAERFRRRLETRLQQALGRSVHFGSIAPRLLPRPGFSIENVTIREDPAFGSEPFARVDHIDCDLVLLGLLRGRIELGSLRLQGATINLVRDSADHWNVERVVSVAGPAPAGSKPATLSVELQDGRLNFKEGPVKKPFSVTGLDGRVTVDRSSGVVSFDVSGTPVRTDLGLPSPGRLALTGTWKSSAGGVIDAALRTRGALLYDWIPLATGRNPGIYGVLDADSHISGPLALLALDAQIHLSQVRRWESLPPTGDLPVNVAVRATLDRGAGQVHITGMAADFGKSRVQFDGVLSEALRQPVLDMTASAAAARLQDVGGLVARLYSKPDSWAALGTTGLTGLVDGQVAIQGPWSGLSYSGSLNTHEGRLIVRGVSLPLSDTMVRARGRSIELAPVRITTSTGVDIIADGRLQLAEPNPAATVPQVANRGSHHRVSSRAVAPPPEYQASLSTRSASAQALVESARNLGFAAARDLQAHGSVSATLTMAGSGWPPSAPVFSGSAEVRNAQVGVPGLARPIELREARLQLNGDRVSVNPATFSIGESVFTGRLEHSGARSRPWTFNLNAAAPLGTLDLGEAASWFEALGHRPAFEWLARVPGLGTLAARRAAGTTLFNALNAQGEFSAPVLAYAGVNLRDFHANIEMRQRVLRVTAATFQMSTGRGQGEGTADLSGPLPHLAADFSIAGLRIENWAAHLPRQLAGVHGSAGLEGRLAADGTSRSELESTVEGRGVLSLANVELGHFDPLRDVAHAAAWGDLAPNRGPVTLREATLNLEIKGQRLIVKPARFEFAGAEFELSGTCAFDRSAQFESTADLRHVNRRWLEDNESQEGRVTRFLLTGPLDALNARRTDQASATTPVRP